MIISDNTGLELQEVGIESSIGLDDLQDATKKSLISGKPIWCHFGVVDEKAEAEDFVSRRFHYDFKEKVPPKPDFKKLKGRMSDKAKVHQAWRRKRALYHLRWAQSVKGVREAVEEFQLLALDLQAENSGEVRC